MINPYVQIRITAAILGVCLLAAGDTRAQRQLDHWIFGNRVHLDFASGNPVQVTGTTLYAAEGSAVMSDANGNLLFYTNGETVWTSNHSIMSNGTGLQGHFSGSQNSLIIPVPGSTTRYYIFTNGHHNDNLGIQYSIVDMSLNSGAGAVTTTKNVVLLPGPTTEKLTAVKHCNGEDFWVLTRRWNSNEFLAYLVTSTGISTTPVVSVSSYNLATLSSAPGVGTVGRIGYMKSSPSGTRIAAFHAWSNAVEIADFNPWNGQFSNILVIPAVRPGLPVPAVGSSYVWAYNGEFSPNGRYLYMMTNYWVNTMPSARASTLIYQLDVSVMNTTAIEASRYRIDSFVCLDPASYNGAGSAQLASNGKIYIAPSWRTSLSVINDPNQGGAACGYQDAAFNLSTGTQITAGLPNFFPYFFATYVNSDFSFTGNCDSLNVRFAYSDPAGVDSLVWSFGDPASGSANTSRRDTLMHRFSDYGLYTVRLIAYKKAASICYNVVDTIIKQVFIPYLDIGKDTSLCSDSLQLPLLPVRFPGGNYLWSSGDTTPSVMARSSGTYWLAQQQHGCTVTDTILLDLNGSVKMELGPDTVVCDSDMPLVLRPRPAAPSGAEYVWSTGLTSPSVAIDRTGTYWLRIRMNGCLSTDTIRVEVVQRPVVSLAEDTVICSQWPLRIGTVIAGARHSWNTGATTPYIEVSETGAYILSADIKGCVAQDTIQVTAMPVPDIDLGGDRDICPLQTMTLDASYGRGSSYAWNTGDTTAVYTAEDPGVYAVRVISEHGCIGGDTVTLSYYPLPSVRLGQDTSVCEETPLLLNAWQINADSLVWSEGSVGDRLSVRYGGVYLVTGHNKCGTASDTISVQQIFCDIWVPNAFTPNNDGSNDVFRILGNTGRMQSVSFSVFNRWGERIFFTHDKNQGWDGRINGVDALLGTYVYLLQYALDNKPYIQKGNFHLIR